MQEKVRQLFRRIGEEVGPEKWCELDAGKSIEDVEGDLVLLVRRICERDDLGQVGKLWM